jgi:hypothetical protein
MRFRRAPRIEANAVQRLETFSLRSIAAERKPAWARQMRPEELHFDRKFRIAR